jgi:hypothetical protein
MVWEPLELMEHFWFSNFGNPQLIALEKTRLMEGINVFNCYFAVVEILDTLTHPELTAIQVRCIVNRVLTADLLQMQRRPIE